MLALVLTTGALGGSSPLLTTTLAHCLPTDTNTCDLGPPIPERVVSLMLGSDPGVVCLRADLPPSEPNSGWLVWLSAGSPAPLVARWRLGGGSAGSIDECTSGFDPALLADLFANPTRYWIVAYETEPTAPSPCGFPDDGCGLLVGQLQFAASPQPGGNGGTGGGQLPDASTRSRGLDALVPIGLLAVVLAAPMVMLRPRKVPRRG